MKLTPKMEIELRHVLQAAQKELEGGREFAIHGGIVIHDGVLSQQREGLTVALFTGDRARKLKACFDEVIKEERENQQQPKTE